MVRVRLPSAMGPGPTGKDKSISLASVRYAFRTIIWPRRGLLLVGLVLITLNRLAGLVLPASSKYMFNDVLPRHDTRLLWQLLAAVGAAVTVQAVTSFIVTRLLSVEAQRLIAELRVRVQKHIIRMSLHYFDNHKAGALVSRIMNDVEGVRNLVGTGVIYMVGGILTGIVSLVFLLRISPFLTAVGLIPLAIFGLVSFKAFGYIRPIFRNRWERNSEVTGRLTETLSGIRVIKGFHAEERESEVFRQGADDLFTLVRTTLTATSLVSSIAVFLMGAASVALMGLGGMLIFKGVLDQGELISFSLFMAFMITPIMQMSNIGSQLTESFAGLDRMEEILRLKREGEGEGRTRQLGRVEGRLLFENINFAYDDDGPRVLQNITFAAAPGTVTALVGVSGSGKSTIAGLAASFYTPDTGRILIDGIDLKEVDLASYRTNLGVVLQDEFLFDGTIRENVLFADPAADENRLKAAVEAANVGEFVDRFEHGLDTVIGERGVKLSGGQRQRIAIARALLADPRILILDEATSSLDTVSEGLIQESLARLMEGRTTLVIAHRLSTIRKADQILVLESGVIAERGTHDELIRTGGRYHELYTYQARI